MTTDITELAQSEINDALAQLKQISEYPTPSTQYARVLRKYIASLVEALEKAQAKATQQGNIAALCLTRLPSCAAMLQAGTFREISETSTNSPEPNPIDHGYRPDCECSGCKSTARICAELAGNSPVNDVTAGKPLTNCDTLNSKSRCGTKAALALDSLPKNTESRCGNSQVLPDDWVMVPKEPTQEMFIGGGQAIVAAEMVGEYHTDTAKKVWGAMLAAAPQEVK